MPWVLFSVSPLHFDIEDTEPIILEWRLGVLWLAGIDDGDDEHITVSLDMVTEQTTLSVGVVGHIAMQITVSVFTLKSGVCDCLKWKS